VISLGELPEGPLGVAVSGGGDSVALLVLLHRAGANIKAATVNHQLRAEAADEAEGVAELCNSLGIPHTTLVWETPTTSGNLQKAAREARQNLLASWAKAENIQNIALGHTLDDQAETVVMRLARGSGVDGLAGMATKRCAAGLCWHRPLLGVRRAALRGYLREQNVAWVDDPTNEDERFDRIKARHALEVLEPLGLDALKLAETANHMRRAREALEADTLRLAHSCATVSMAGEVCLALEGFRKAPREVQLRLLAAALGWVSSAGYRPRFTMLENLLKACLNQSRFGKTLHGCKITGNGDEIMINREVSATPALAPLADMWDGRWQFDLKGTKNLSVKALGESGLLSCPDWRETGHNRDALLASPSLWQNGQLWAAPLALFGQFKGVKLAGGTKGFYDAVKTR